jgi:type IV secretory pathway VirJ component
MTRRLAAGLLCALGVLAAAVQAQSQPVTQTLEQGRFGALQLRLPAGRVRGLVLFLPRESGWDTVTDRFAQALLDQGLAVAALDSGHYLAALRQRQKGCHYLAADFEDLAHRVAREAALGEYATPVLVGLGAGATLVRLGQMQAPAGSFEGALGLAPAAAIELGPLHLCAGPHGPLAVRTGPHGEVSPDPVVGPAEAYATVTATRPAEAPAALATAVDHLLARATPASAAPASADLRDLPIVELPVQAPARRFALMLSGDGGWAGIDREVGAQLAARGVPVVGVSTLKYFWQRRSPDAAAADMARLLRHYLAAWKVDRVVLVGYSFGADVLPFIVNRLPADLRSRIDSVNLLGLGTKADFEIHVTGWVGGAGADAVPIAPELARLTDLRRLCFYGAGDRDSAAACAGFTGPGAAARQVGEGHHFGYRYGEIASAIVEYAGP